MKQVFLCFLACWGLVPIAYAQEPAAPSKKTEIQQMPEFLGEHLKELDAYKRNFLSAPITTQATDFQALEYISKVLAVGKLEISESESELPGRTRKRRMVQGPTDIDSRIEVRAFPVDTPWRAAYFYNVESVGLVIERQLLTEVSDSFYQVDLSRSLAQVYSLCPEEPYGLQPVLGLGTCFVRDSVSMITAAHVLEGALHQYAVVFDYEMVLKSGFVNPFIRKDNVFFPQKMPWRSEELDLALFQLDRRCNRAALRFAPPGDIKVDDDVYMIGHPSGLPKKAAFNAEITDASHPQYFYTSLDAFQGNSGSPVFSLKTHEVIGVLVSGGADFQWRGACNVSNVCRAPYCPGERVVRILLE